MAQSDEDKARAETTMDGETQPPAPELQAEIGVRLKAYYDTITREPVPDRFMELLGALDGVDAPAGSQTPEEDA